jgi:hypothetical protein
MGVAPESYELKDLSREIDEILEILRIQNSLLGPLLPQSVKMRSDLKEPVSRFASPRPNLKL